MLLAMPKVPSRGEGPYQLPNESLGHLCGLSPLNPRFISHLSSKLPFPDVHPQKFPTLMFSPGCPTITPWSSWDLLVWLVLRATFLLACRPPSLLVADCNEHLRPWIQHDWELIVCMKGLQYLGDLLQILGDVWSCVSHVEPSASWIVHF